MSSKRMKRKSSSPPDGPWYRDGLQFECLPDCGACCTNHGDYSYVYLEGDDATRLAAHFEMGVEEFTERYAMLEDGFPMLRMDGPDCLFLEGSRCTVYGARPTQCRTFPFWEENVSSPARWKRLRDFCPGIGQGETQTLLQIESCLEERSGAE